MARPPGIKKVFPNQTHGPSISDLQEIHRAAFPTLQYQYTTSLWIDGRWFPAFDQLGEQGWEGWAVTGEIAHFKRMKG